MSKLYLMYAKSNSRTHCQVSDSKVWFLNIVLMLEPGWSLFGDRWSTRTCTLQSAFVSLETVWQLAAGTVVQMPGRIGLVQKHSDCWMRDYRGFKIRITSVLSGIQPGQRGHHFHGTVRVSHYPYFGLAVLFISLHSQQYPVLLLSWKL